MGLQYVVVVLMCGFFSPVQTGTVHHPQKHDVCSANPHDDLRQNATTQKKKKKKRKEKRTKKNKKQKQTRTIIYFFPPTIFMCRNSTLYMHSVTHHTDYTSQSFRTRKPPTLIAGPRFIMPIPEASPAKCAR